MPSKQFQAPRGMKSMGTAGGKMAHSFVPSVSYQIKLFHSNQSKATQELQKVNPVFH